MERCVLWFASSYSRRSMASSHSQATVTDASFKYLVPWARVGNARKETHDPETRDRLWTWLEEQTKGF